ncbi:MAG: hypothetical protein CSA95_05785 [Bacteroidetes bacterium]|nr:MAG: hypothetical protein CSA95_05785 [Bacteroidota bacterium]
MRHIGLLLFLFLFSVVLHAQNAIGIGQWRDHLPYNRTLSVAEMGSRVYCATPFSLFYLDREDAGVGRINKVTTSGLSDVGITAMEGNADHSLLVVAYKNANVDIVEEDGVYNISDIKRSNLVGNKVIHNIFMKDDLAYLACGFGVVVLDVKAKEVKDTWIIGPEASYVNVMDITYHAADDHFYVATENGIFRADASLPNLADFNVWHYLDFLPVPDANYNVITSFGGKVITNLSSWEYGNDTLYTFTGDQWDYFDPTLFSDVRSIRVSRGELMVAYRIKFRSFDTNFNTVLDFYTYGEGRTPSPMKGIVDGDGVYWIADDRYGMDRCTGPWNHELIMPNGPTSPFSFSLTASQNDVWVADGGYNTSWVPLNNKGLISRYRNDVWETYDFHSFPPFDTIRNIAAIAVDPSDQDHIYVASFGRGLHEIRDGELVRSYDATNSPLKPPIGYQANKIRVSDVRFDEAHNLWCAVSLGDDVLTVLKPNGEWVDLNLPSYARGVEGSTLTIDHLGQKWLIMREANAVIVFSDNGTLDDLSDDRTRKLSSSPGNGGFPGGLVHTIACDLDGEMWIGTNEGIAVIYNPENVFGGGSFDAQQILVEYDGHVRPLLESESVTAIAVDGANKKWIGTDKTGVFLLSEDGTKELAHYTRENSPLLSNTITSITIDDKGEVFFGTTNGIVSYRGTSTPGKTINHDVYAFPNPVREGYEGVIAINGLVNDAYVKITDVSGNLVFATRAEGGQASWNGRTKDGDKVATGVYLVFVSDQMAKETIVTKIMVIR